MCLLLRFGLGRRGGGTEALDQARLESGGLVGVDVSLAGGAVEHGLRGLELGCGLGRVASLDGRVGGLALGLELLGGDPVADAALLALAEPLGGAVGVGHVGSTSGWFGMNGTKPTHSCGWAFGVTGPRRRP